MRKFLTARWADLIMANYEVDASILTSRLPAGTEIDLNDGKCFVSLVGFMFLDTRVRGFLIPGHINFEEVNLRFYVTHGAQNELRRGVVFIKEIVPKSAIVLVARMLYGEAYERWDMSNSRSGSHVRYEWNRKGCRNSIGVERGVKQGVPAPGSHGEFIIEHYWGYTRRNNARTDEYKVEHPQWDLFDVGDVQINVDFAETYGDEFSFLTGMDPHSILLAEGSEITVYKGNKINAMNSSRLAGD